MHDFRFIHAADIHLDSPLIGLARYEGAPSEDLREATRVALTNLVRLAIDVGAKFVVIAGDLYDGAWKDMRTGLFAVEQFAALARAGIRVFIVYGNHDAESRITRGLTPPDGVHIFGNKGCESIPVDDLNTVIHGQSFKSQHTYDNLALHYCAPVPGALNIAVLHTGLEGGHSHAHYAPCSKDQLINSGHQYWALGHVHTYDVVHREPYIVYPGNLQGRNIREAGIKGAAVVQVEQGRIVGVEHHPLDQVRWEHLRISTQHMRQSHELIEAVDHAIRNASSSAGGRLVAARVEVELSGASAKMIDAQRWLLEADIRAATARTASDCWIEKVIFKKSSVADYALPPALDEILRSAESDEDCLRYVRAELDGLLGKVPPDVCDDDTTPLFAALRRGEVAKIIADGRDVLALKLQGEDA